MKLIGNRVCICCGDSRPAGDFNRTANPNVCQACAGLLDDTEFIRRPQAPETNLADSSSS